MSQKRDTFIMCRIYESSLYLTVVFPTVNTVLFCLLSAYNKSKIQNRASESIGYKKYDEKHQKKGEKREERKGVREGANELLTIKPTQRVGVSQSLDFYMNQIRIYCITLHHLPQWFYGW